MGAGGIKFIEYLRSAIRAAGYATPTQLARDAELDPSVVLRWLGGSQRPTVRSLERVAPLLGRSTAEMVRAAYPDRLGGDGTAETPMHELAYVVDHVLSSDSPIPESDRAALEHVLRRVLEPYQKDLMHRRGRRRASIHEARPATDG
ncbi:MAG TPA: XRE family transcriptional regulator [Micromonosporaceae bacterium]